MVLFRSPTLFRRDYGSETKRKQTRRLGKKGIVHLSDTKAFCLFGNHGISVFVSYKDSETSQTLRGRRSSNTRGRPTQEGKL